MGVSLKTGSPLTAGRTYDPRRNTIIVRGEYILHTIASSQHGLHIIPSLKFQKGALFLGVSPRRHGCSEEAILAIHPLPSKGEPSL